MQIVSVCLPLTSLHPPEYNEEMVIFTLDNPQSFLLTILTGTISSGESSAKWTVSYSVTRILSLERQLYAGGSRNLRFLLPKLSALFNGSGERVRESFCN